MSVYLFFKHRRARLTLIYSIFCANYLNLITLTQFKVLRAIAIEGKIDQPNSGSFLARHALGAASTVAQAVESLAGKGLGTKKASTIILTPKIELREYRNRNELFRLHGNMEIVMGLRI